YGSTCLFPLQKGSSSLGLVEVTEWHIYSVNLELVLSRSRRKHRLFYFHCEKVPLAPWELTSRGGISPRRRPSLTLRNRLALTPNSASTRGKREMVASQAQMNLAQVPVLQRDYCAHHLIKLMKCKRDNWPNFLACKHERHDWDYCEHQDYVMRMKEYERERRLQMRKKRVEEAQAA
uniref:NADH dehydrogenase [ubiquinone] 1 beta subcomplex subunit 7 n=1 Tax=Oncorhynchus kisutch TaxID=8019 RepID=A0A8C7K130_ONCKI